MTPAALQGIDSGLSKSLTVGSVATNAYCLQDTVGGKVASVDGPGGTVTKVAC
jgi:hypothetical protein